MEVLLNCILNGLEKSSGLDLILTGSSQSLHERWVEGCWKIASWCLSHDSVLGWSGGCSYVTMLSQPAHIMAHTSKLQEGMDAFLQFSPCCLYVTLSTFHSSHCCESSHCFFTVTRENLMLFFGSYVSVIAKSSTKNNSLQFCLLWFLLLFEVLMVWMRQALCKQTLQDAFKDSQSWDRICLRVLSVFLPLMPHWMCLLQHIYR